MNRECFYSLIEDPAGRDFIFGTPKTKQLPIKWQLARLGLGEDKLWDLRRKKLLDFGCGNGELVKFLVNEGIYAEGIDPGAPEGEMFMQQKVEASYPGKGSIPRENESYDTIVCNSNNILCLAFSNHRKAFERMNRSLDNSGRRPSQDISKRIKSIEKEGEIIMLEVLRALKRGGEFICSPYLDTLKDKMGYEISGEKYRIKKELDESIIALELKVKSNPGTLRVLNSMGYETSKEVFPDFLKHRMIIYKN